MARRLRARSLAARRRRTKGCRAANLRGALKWEVRRLSDIELKSCAWFLGLRRVRIAFLRRPRGPAIDLEPARIAAYPVGIDEDRCVAPRPLRGFGKHVPVGDRQQGWCDVELLQLRACAEVRVDFVGEVVAGVGGEMRRLSAQRQCRAA